VAIVARSADQWAQVSTAGGNWAYVVDFVCFASKLIIELDGPQHQEREAAERDARRTEWLESRGFRIVRFRNHELDEGVQLVLDAIRRELARATPNVAHPPSPALPAEGRGPEELGQSKSPPRRDRRCSLFAGTTRRSTRRRHPFCLLALQKNHVASFTCVRESPCSPRGRFHKTTRRRNHPAYLTVGKT
jgi:hypothetical protein